MCVCMPVGCVYTQTKCIDVHTDINMHTYGQIYTQTQHTNKHRRTNVNTHRHTHRRTDIIHTPSTTNDA